MAVQAYPPLPPSVSAGSGAVPWVPGSYAKDALVIDTTINVQFRALKAIGSSTILPSIDPNLTNWVGEDQHRLGTLTHMANIVDAGPNKTMRAGRDISRTKYVRLLNAIAPVVPGCGITNGSTALRLPATGAESVSIGDVVEGVGIITGTTVLSLSTGGSKTGTVDSGVSTIFWKPGVVSAGFTLPSTAEVGGAGLTLGTTLTSTVADAVTSFDTVAGSTSIFANTTDNPSGKIGGYLSGAGISANTRLTKFDPRSQNPGNAGAVSGSTSLFMSTDFYGLIDESLLIGRPCISSSFGIAKITAIAQPEEAIPGSFNYVNGKGIFAPWDLAPAQQAKFLTSRKVSVATVLPASSDQVTTTLLPTTRSGAVTSGGSSFFYQTGQVAVSGAVDRKVGNLSAAVPANAYVTANQAETVGTPVNVLTGSSRLFSPIGAATVGSIGQFITTAAGGIAQARVTAVQVETARPNTGTLLNQNSLFVQPGIPPATLSVGQVVATNAPAGTTLAAVGSDFAVIKASWDTSTANAVNLPVGTSVAPFTGGRKITGAGIAANTALTGSSVAQVSDLTNGTVTGATSSFLFIAVDATTTSFMAGRYLQHPALPLDTSIIGNPLAQVTQANAATNFSGPEIFWPGGSTLPPAAVVGTFVTAQGITSPARIVSTTAANVVSTATNVVGSGVIVLPVGLYNAATMQIGRGVSMAGIPAGAKINAVAPDTAPFTATTVSGSTTLTSAGLFLPNMFGRYISGPGIPTNTRITVVVSNSSVTMSTPAFSSGTSTVQVGSQIVASAPSTGSSVNAPVTFTAYVTTDTNAVSGGLAVVKIGAVVPLSAAATSTIGPGSTTLLGPIVTLTAPVTANGTDVPAALGAVHVLSTLATATNAATTTTFGRFLTLDQSATASTGTAMTAGAISTLNAPATADSTAPLTFGGVFNLASPTATTARDQINLQLGAVLTLASPATSSASFMTVVFSAVGVMSAPATVTGTPSIAFGGYSAIDQAPVSSNVDVAFTFGGGVSISVPATASNETASLWFFPYGAGDGSTTFGIALSPTGRTLGVAGQGAGLTLRPVGSAVGVEDVALKSGQSGMPSHAHSVNEPAHTHGLTDPGHSHNYSGWGGVKRNVASGSTYGVLDVLGATSEGGRTTGSSTTSMTVNAATIGISVNSNSADAAQSHTNMPPTVFGAKALTIYAGAA